MTLVSRYGSQWSPGIHHTFLVTHALPSLPLKAPPLMRDASPRGDPSAVRVTSPWFVHAERALEMLTCATEVDKWCLTQAEELDVTKEVNQNGTRCSKLCSR